MSGEGLANPNAAWWTATPNDWAQVTLDPNGGWFGYQFTLLNANETAYASGINFCTSANIGATWNCGPPADSVFDGPTQFISDKIGWTGGGEISPDVEGWLHLTTNGGKDLERPRAHRAVADPPDRVSEQERRLGGGGQHL